MFLNVREKKKIKEGAGDRDRLDTCVEEKNKKEEKEKKEMKMYGLE